MVTFSEISPSELALRYQEGVSISELAAEVGGSYTAVRKSLLATGVILRSRVSGASLYLERHPEWSKQFLKYRVEREGEITEDKVALLAMIITEGYSDRTSVGFTNNQELLHMEFEDLFTKVYGHVRVSRSGNLSRVSSAEISKDLSTLMPGKIFGEAALSRLMNSRQTIVRVLRIIADTEGAMLVSLRKAPRNYTAESRIVLASTNKKFRGQVASLLAKLSIGSRSNVDGVIVNRKEDIRRFIKMVGFTPGIKVVRKKAGVSVWYGKEKYVLSKLFLRIYAEQEEARRSGRRGCFANCRRRFELMDLLTNWYEAMSGGER